MTTSGQAAGTGEALNAVPASAKVTRWTLSLLPEDEHGDASMWDVHVEYRGRGLWAVLGGSCCLSDDWQWDYEPQPSSRTDEWMASHRFTENEALHRADISLASITVNGMTAQQYLDRWPVSS